MWVGGGVQVGGGIGLGLAQQAVCVLTPLALTGSRLTGLKPPMAEVNAKMALLRLRLYRTLISLPPASFEGRHIVCCGCVEVQHCPPPPV